MQRDSILAYILARWPERANTYAVLGFADDNEDSSYDLGGDIIIPLYHEAVSNYAKLGRMSISLDRQELEHQKSRLSTEEQGAITEVLKVRKEEDGTLWDNMMGTCRVLNEDDLYYILVDYWQKGLTPQKKDLYLSLNEKRTF